MKKQGRRRDMSVFEDLIRKYSQDQTLLDPTQLQVGQSIFDQAGAEFTVLEDPEGTTNKVLAPAQQTGTMPVEEVQTVEDTEIQSTYTLQPSSGAQGAQGPGEAVTAGYADFLDSRYDDTSAPYADTPSAADWGGYNSGEEGSGEWVNSGKPSVPRIDPTSQDRNPRTKTKAPEMSGPLNPDDNPIKRDAALHMDLDGLMPRGKPDLQSEEDGFILGESGYVDIMNDIKAMVDSGYQTIDVILNIGELYDRGIGERVLAEARKKGIL